jgi:spermidine/putrescine-binding protein
VLKKTRTLLESNGTRFVVVLWDKNELAKAMLKTLRANQFDVIALSSVFSESDMKNGLLTQGDLHPSPATDKAIAAYLWKQIGEPLTYAKHSQ